MTTKKSEKKYKVVLNVLGEKWVARGDTLLKAMQGLKISWEQIKGKGMFNIYVYEKKKHEHLFTMPVIRKILANKIVKAHWAKSLEYLIKGDNKSNLPQKYDKKK